MKKALSIAGVLAITITPTASFADHLEPKESEIRPGGNLNHTNLSGSDLSRSDLSKAKLMNTNLMNAKLSRADLSKANLSGITANNLRVCPRSLPSGWVCENNSLIQR